MSLSTAPVSVIVPCLNGGRTLAESLDSVFAQTAPPLEVLLVDDGSTDNSIEVARSFGPRVRIMRNPSRGPGAARQLGVLEARGEYIAFIDADDVVEPTKHEKQLAVLESAGPHTLVHTGSRVFWDDNRRPARVRLGGELAVGRCTRVVFERNPVCGASTMMARSTILEAGNYDPELFGTEDFGMSLAASVSCEFVYIPEPLYHMRQHGGNLTARAAHMAYHHWLAQERFRLAHPTAFAALPFESVQRYMVEPVVRTVKTAYWNRNSAGYNRLLELAVSIAPDDEDLRRLWRRRAVPMWALRAYDRWRTRRIVAARS